MPHPPVTTAKRIGLVSAWASRAGGGVFEALVAHAGLVRACGHVPVVIALEDEHSAADRARFGDIEVIVCPVAGPRFLGFAPGMARALDAAKLDLLHLHGIWTGVSRATGGWARETGRPYVISPHGMLDPWILSRGKVKKAVGRALFERRSWNAASLFHALTQREAADIQGATGRGVVVTIPNLVPAAGPHAPFADPPVIFYLSRIHPKKNVEALVDAWALTTKTEGAKLVIAGWGADEDVASLRARIVGTDVEFVGPCFGEDKAVRLAGARFTVLASHSEGLPVAILEAWAAGTPVIMTEHCNLPIGFAARAAIECGTDAPSIAAAFSTALAMPQGAWQAMSDASLALIDRDFSPQVVTEKWRAVYDGLLQP